MPECTPKLGTSVLDDRELLEKATRAENGDRFERLYEEGWDSEILQMEYEGPEGARLALVNFLVWWSRHDEKQVWRLFSKSALCPDDLARTDDEFQGLVAAATDLLGEECYDPNHF